MKENIHAFTVVTRIYSILLLTIRNGFYSGTKQCGVYKLKGCAIYVLATQLKYKF